MGKNISFGVIGLVIGLIIGFTVANSLNKNDAPQETVQTQSINPNLAPKVPNIEVKEQPQTGEMLPGIAETLEKAKNEPTNFDVQMEAGNLYFKIKNFEKASEFYDQANSLNPTEYEKIVKLGNSYFDISKFEKAEIFYQTALKQKPDDFGVRTDLGITYVERANPDFDKAIKEFNKSLQTNPKHEPTIYNLGIAYYKKGQFVEANEMLQKLESINPQSKLAEKLKKVIQ